MKKLISYFLCIIIGLSLCNMPIYATIANTISDVVITAEITENNTNIVKTLPINGTKTTPTILPNDYKYGLFRLNAKLTKQGVITVLVAKTDEPITGQTVMYTGESDTVNNAATNEFKLPYYVEHSKTYEIKIGGTNVSENKSVFFQIYRPPEEPPYFGGIAGTVYLSDDHITFPINNYTADWENAIETVELAKNYNSSVGETQPSQGEIKEILPAGSYEITPNNIIVYPEQIPVELWPAEGSEHMLTLVITATYYSRPAISMFNFGRKIMEVVNPQPYIDGLNQLKFETGVTIQNGITPVNTVNLPQTVLIKGQNIAIDWTVKTQNPIFNFSQTAVTATGFTGVEKLEITGKLRRGDLPDGISSRNIYKTFTIYATDLPTIKYGNLTGNSDNLPTILDANKALKIALGFESYTSAFGSLNNMAVDKTQITQKDVRIISLVATGNMSIDDVIKEINQ